jgi:hypothetical protein
MCPILQYSNFFIVKDPFKKDDEQQNDFLQNLGLLIMKNQLSLQFVEVFGSNAQFYICVLELSSLFKNKFFMGYYISWWKKQNTYTFYQNW